MKLHHFSILAVACLFSFTACRQSAEAPADPDQIKTEIQAREDAWATALNARDVDALMAMYTEDAVVMPSNTPLVAGKDAIRENQQKEFAGMPPGMTFSFEVLDVYANGNTVTETGQSTYRDAAGNVTGTGKYMVVWEKQGDQYLCAREIYNEDAAPPPASRKSLHLFDMPAGVTEAEWSAALREMNGIIADMGYPNSGYFLYKTTEDEPADYRYFFEGVWPSEEAYQAIHKNPAWVAASEKLGPLYEKIKAVEIYRRMNRVE